MEAPTQSLHNQKVREVAENYRRRGYLVRFEPEARYLPEFLDGYRPDLIAESPEESVVVEVKLAGAAKADKWRWLAQTMQNQPNWRLDLIVTDPINAIPGDPRLSEAEIEKRLKDADRLEKSGTLDIALLVLWTAVEAALRRLCDKYDVELPDEATGTVITRLYADSLMERDDYDALMRGLVQRNAAGHGYKTPISPHDLTLLRAVARRIMSE